MRGGARRPVTVVKGDATGVPWGEWEVVHGVLGPRKDVAPKEVTFSQSLVELGDQVLPNGWGGDKTRYELRPCACRTPALK